MLLLTCAAAMLALHAGLAGARSTATDPPPAAICGLEGFKLNTLELPESWNFRMKEKRNCIIPNGTSEDDIQSCTVYFSICKALPATVCNGVTNSTTCEVVTLTNGTKEYYNIGDYRGNDEFAALGGNTTGFVAMRQGSQPINGLVCQNKVYETIITWSCDGKKNWNPSSTDVSGFVHSASKIATNCLLDINLGYDGACYVAPTVAPDTCQLDPYSFVGLASQPYWRATVPNGICYNEASIDCQIFISFCDVIPLDIGTGCYGASICQVGTDLNTSEYSYSMGQFKTATYTDNAQVVGGGFHLDVEKGSTPVDHKCDHLGGIKTRVVFTCNTSVKWTGQDQDQDISAVFHVVSVDPLDRCQYVIDLPYEGACEQVGPISGGRNPQSFVGWILIGIFFFAVMVYLMVGAGFEYFVKGARGIEAIPNYAFWMMFFMLALDGCKLSFNVITCFKFEGTIKNPLSGPGKSGIDYDKI